MALADLKTLMNASAQNMSQFKGLSAAYGILLGGTPSIDGYTSLINTNNTTNFGAGATGPTFNDENIYINTINALYQGNATAKANFDAIVAGQASIQDALTAVYNYVIPVTARTQAGLDYFKSQASFYAGRAAELGVAGTNGTALVAFASLTKIAVDNDIAGLGDTINDLRAAVDAGSAVIPQGGNVFTPLETADGTAFDGDDASGGTVAATFTLTPGTDFADVAGSFRNGPPGVATDFRFTSNNEVVNATSATLMAVDTLADGSTTDSDTLNVSMLGNVTTSLVQNIETFNFSTSGATAAGLITLAGVTGLKAINITGTSAAPITIAGTNIGNTGVTTIDASGVSTNVVFTVDSSTSTATAGLTIKGVAIGPNFITGGLGNDTLTGGSGGDTITGGAGDDVIDAGNGANFVFGGSGNNTITTGTGNDTVTVTSGNNTISVGNGTNTVIAASGNDTITGGTGIDTITTGGGNDVVRGGGGADVITLTNTASAGNSETLKLEATAGANGLDAITNFLMGPTGVGGDKIDASAFLGAAVSNYVEILSGVANNVATSNVVVITDGTFAAATVSGLVLKSSANILVVEDSGADATAYYLTTDANGTVVSNTAVLTLTGIAGAGIAAFDAGQFV